MLTRSGKWDRRHGAGGSVASKTEVCPKFETDCFEFGRGNRRSSVVQSFSQASALCTRQKDVHDHVQVSRTSNRHAKQEQGLDDSKILIHNQMGLGGWQRTT